MRNTTSKGGLYHFLAGSTAFFLLLNLLIISVPGAFQEYTGVNTTQLQDSTNISANVNSNQTTSTNVVSQADSIVSVYTNFESENQVLTAIGTVYTVLLAAALIDLIWVG